MGSPWSCWGHRAGSDLVPTFQFVRAKKKALSVAEEHNHIHANIEKGR